jgi:protein TonB
MAPYPIAPPEVETLTPPAEEQSSKSAGPRRKAAARTGQPLFAEALLDMSTTRPGRRTWDFFLSLFIHGLFLATLLLIPLYFTEAIDLKQFTQTLLVAPPPPPPPPPASPVIAKVSSVPRRVFTSAGKLLAPTAIPEKVAMLKEEALPPEVGLGEGVVGGVPGGVPGGQIGGVIGGIISGARTYVPVAPTTAPKAPLRVGGRVKAPRPLSQVQPVYPELAKQAKIQGQVVIDAVIDTNGNVVEMRVVSGHPLLIPAAFAALSHWKYEPTYLNEQPIPVQLLVTISFRLN